MSDETTQVDLAERVALLARELGIETVVIGAYGLAIHGYVRGTNDLDLASSIELSELLRLRRHLEDHGLSTDLRSPDEHDALGGRLIIWEQVDEMGAPFEPVEVVNFFNSHRPRSTPARDAIRGAQVLDGKPGLRFPSLADLIALKLYAGSLRDEADVVEVLVCNPATDVERVRETCRRYGLDRIDDLIAAAAAQRRRS